MSQITHHPHHYWEKLSTQHVATGICCDVQLPSSTNLIHCGMAVLNHNSVGLSRPQNKTRNMDHATWLPKRACGVQPENTTVRMPASQRRLLLIRSGHVQARNITYVLFFVLHLLSHCVMQEERPVHRKGNKTSTHNYEAASQRRVLTGIKQHEWTKKEETASCSTKGALAYSAQGYHTSSLSLIR